MACVYGMAVKERLHLDGFAGGQVGVEAWRGEEQPSLTWWLKKLTTSR